MRRPLCLYTCDGQSRRPVKKQSNSLLSASFSSRSSHHWHQNNASVAMSGVDRRRRDVEYDVLWSELTHLRSGILGRIGPTRAVSNVLNADESASLYGFTVYLSADKIDWEVDIRRSISFRTTNPIPNSFPVAIFALFNREQTDPGDFHHRSDLDKFAVRCCQRLVGSLAYAAQSCND